MVAVVVASEPSANPAQRDTPVKARVRLARLIDAIPVKWWLAIVAALILAASAIFGGLDDAAPAEAETPVLSAGEPFVGPELTASLHEAWLTDLAPGLTLNPDDGFTFLVVSATVTNTWTRSTTAIRDLLQLEWIVDDTAGEPDRTALISDGTPSPQAEPGVPMEVAYIWQVPIDRVADGDTVRVAIRSKTLTVDGDVTFGSYWADPTIAAQVDLEVSQ